MKKIMIIIVSIWIAMTSLVYADDVDLFGIEESDAVVRTINEFNVVRQSLGLSPMTINEDLKDMAKMHSKYMNHNYVLSSIEESDYEFFRGRYPWDRAAYFDYDADYVYEFVKKDIVNYGQGLSKLINDPVGRYILFDPMYIEAGMAIEEGYVTYLFGGNQEEASTFVNYPYRDQTDVVTQWHGDSYDAIYEDVMAENKVGLPITVTHYGGDIEMLLAVDIKLRNQNKDEKVDFELLMPGDYYLLKNTLTILPIKPFDYNTSYDVHVEFDMLKTDGEIVDYEVNYSFTTEGETLDLDKSPYITRGTFTEDLVKEFGYNLVEPLESKFIDVPLSSQQSIYIYTASREGLINGLSANEFSPDLNITKEQAYIIFVRAFENKNDPIIVTDEGLLNGYLDHLSISDWARSYLLKASELGIIADVKGLIQPDKYLTKDEFELMVQLYNKTTSTLSN